MQREAEEHRHEQHLEDLAFGEGVEDRGRDDVEDVIDRALHLAGGGELSDGLGVEAGGVDVHPGAGAHHIDDDEADHEGQRAHDLKVQHGEAAGLADLLHVSMPAIPMTTVQKMIGAMIILISLMKPSPKGFIASPVAGKKWPSSTPGRSRR